MRICLKDAEDEFVDDSGYTVPTPKKFDRQISSEDIELEIKLIFLKNLD